MGALPHAELIERASDTFRVVGNVDDVSSWYQRARVAIVPLHAGSGSRIKIVEAWAHRRPVVSTSIGAEGLGDARERGALIVADSAAEMAAECERLLGDPELARTVAERGFELYCERYTLKSAFVRIDEAVRVASEGGVS